MHTVIEYINLNIKQLSKHHLWRKYPFYSYVTAFRVIAETI